MIKKYIIQSKYCLPTVLTLSFLFSTASFAQEPNPVEPALVKQFTAKVEPKQFLKQAKESLWQVYPEDDKCKQALVDYVARAKDGTGLAFAAIALIPFHDPATLSPMLTRASENAISPGTRFYILNAAPYVVSVGDAFYMGKGQLDNDTKETLTSLEKMAIESTKLGVGHYHATNLATIYKEALKPKNNDSEGLEMAIWHASAYLLGTLDLKDFDLLESTMDPRHWSVCSNVISALSFASNRDFFTELRHLKQEEGTGEHARKIAEKASENAKVWWRNFLKGHSDGNWQAAVLDGFSQAGFNLDTDLHSPKTQKELLRAIDAPNPILCYNAYRLLNHIYGTHFDLESAFFAGKYAGSFLDPSEDQAKNEARLKHYWKQRLEGTISPSDSLSRSK